MVQHIRSVGGSKQDHVVRCFETIHFHQQSIQGLLTLIMTTTQTGAALTSHSIDFVDEDDAG